MIAQSCRMETLCNIALTRQNAQNVIKTRKRGALSEIGSLGAFGKATGGGILGVRAGACGKGGER